MSALPQLPLTRAHYRQRRRHVAKLLATHEAGPTPVVFFARGAEDLASAHQTCVGKWRQDPWFSWICGCDADDAALVLWPDGRSELFLAGGDPQRVIWDGPRLAPSAAVARHFGVDAAWPIDDLATTLAAAAEAHAGRLGLLWRRREPGAQTALAQRWRRKLARKLDGFIAINVEGALLPLRMRKHRSEIAWHRRAVAKTAAGLQAAWRALPKLTHEGEVAGLLLPHYLGPDHAPPAFATIAGAGANAATLHYPHNDQPFGDATCLLIDSGASAGGYAADVTRTWPLGQWTPRLREIYELVLHTQERAISLLKPGLLWSDWNADAWQPIRDAGFQVHHGIGHHLGLDTHDPADRDEPFAPGMVLTVEPGIYLPDEGIGVRIEDNVLLTADGCEVTTAMIPKTVRQLTRRRG